jgi:hypothetical protein
MPIPTISFTCSNTTLSCALAFQMSERIYKIAAMAGDGIGPEVVREALKVLRASRGKVWISIGRHRGTGRLGRH